MDRLRGKIPDMTFRPLLAAAAFAAALPALSALTALAAPNPCSTVTPVELTGAEEAAYIAKKTAEVFKVSPKLQATPSATAAAYAVPDGWRRELLAFDAVPVEKYERATLFLHGGGYLGGLHDHCRSWGLHLADALTAYSGLLKAGMDPARTVLIGDSAGGRRECGAQDLSGHVARLDDPASGAAGVAGGGGGRKRMTQGVSARAASGRVRPGSAPAGAHPSPGVCCGSEGISVDSICSMQLLPEKAMPQSLAVRILLTCRSIA